MGKRLTYNIITGYDPHLRMCFYYSVYFDQNIWRRGSSLTGERTKKDPAFKGFRQSSNRLKQASPIAASLYKLVPKQAKVYALYRKLTGEAIKMLKEGMEAVVINDTLKKKYIDPLLDAPKKKSGNRVDEEPVTGDRLKGMNDFTSYPPILSRDRKLTNKHRAFLLQKITAGEDLSANDLYTPPAAGRNITASPLSDPEEPKRRTKTTHDLIYLGRLPECKKLKIWLRPI